ncbi:MAG: NAD(P)H-binding protein [Gammaproteobacteria bacterium]|nr:NAD(P)H-binding protein [Gammaproteobacteria bacterium]
MGKVAIVLGATGLVGGHLAKLLCRSNEFSSIICPTRRKLNFEHKKLHNPQINFDQLEKHRELFKGDCLFSCLGTTRKQAGSIAAQRKVDYDYQLEAAKIAQFNQVKHFLLVSSSGANSRSRSPYLKMKGDLEEAVIKLEFSKVTILQPSLLLGARDHIRLAEELGAKLLPALCLLPGLKSYKPIEGKDVALKLLNSSLSQQSGLIRYRLDEVFP